MFGFKGKAGMTGGESAMDDLACDFEAFAKVVRTRRSARAYLPEAIPDAVLDQCLDLALLAPNSQNLEPWQFLDVRDPVKLERLRRLCLSQPQALQAPRLIVAVARPDFWRLGRRLAMEALVRDAPNVPLIAEHLDALLFKYRVLVPVMFEDGPFHVLAPLKRLVLWAVGLCKIFWRFDTGRSGQVLWATKTTALACENLMLALRAAGYDSCAMEGFDEPRVKRLLGRPGPAHIVMIVAAGKRADGGVAPLYRFDRNFYVQRI